MVQRTIRAIPAGTHQFMQRLRLAPFEACTGFVTIAGGIMAFYDGTVASQIFNQALPRQMAIGFDICYILSGFAIIAGLGWNYRNLEAFGLISFITSLLIRFIVLIMTIGWDPITTATLTQQLVFALGACTRLVTLWKRKEVVMVDLDHPLKVSGPDYGH